MSEEQRDKPTIVGREDLYRLVWETPMSRLGAHYGISRLTNWPNPYHYRPNFQKASGQHGNKH